MAQMDQSMLKPALARTLRLGATTLEDISPVRRKMLRWNVVSEVFAAERPSGLKIPLALCVA